MSIISETIKITTAWESHGNWSPGQKVWEYIHLYLENIPLERIESLDTGHNMVSTSKNTATGN